MTFGDRIRELRREKHMSQAELAEKADIMRPYISAIENNKAHNISMKTLNKLAGALGCASIDELFFNVNV